MPVHNVGGLLRQSLDSLLAQINVDWECMCVDDGSTDGSSAILREYADADARFRVIRQENLGTVAARKRAVAAAQGDWALFLDPDDYLTPNALETLSAEADRTDADIVQYGVNVIETIERRAEEHARMAAYFNSPPGAKDAGELYKAVFIDRSLPWNLIGKIVRLNVAHPAFAAQCDAYSINETDMYALFHVIANMDRPLRIIPARLYNYRCGGGISTKPEMTLEEYRRTLGKFDALDALNAIEGLEGDAWRARAAIASQMLGSSFYAAAGRLDDPQDVPAAFDMLLSRVPARELAIALVQRYHATPALLARLVARMGVFRRAPAQDRETGTPRDKTLWITRDAMFCGDDRYPLPPLHAKSPASLVARVQKIMDIVPRLALDSAHSSGCDTPDVFWDLLACKLGCGVRFLIHHPLPCTEALWRAPAASVFTNEADVLRLADCVFVQTKLDRAALLAEGVNAILPRRQKGGGEAKGAAVRKAVNPNEAAYVLWVGRLSSEKHPGDAIRIFARLHRKLGDKVRFVMVGSGEEPFELGVRRQAKDSGLGDAIVFTEQTQDLKPLLDGAAALLATSDFETFPRETIAAVEAGLPAVTYCQPQITTWRTRANVAEVPYRDIAGASLALERAIAGYTAQPCTAPGCEPDDQGNPLPAYIAALKRALFNLHERRTAQIKAVVEKRDAAVAQIAELERASENLQQDLFAARKEARRAEDTIAYKNRALRECKRSLEEAVATIAKRNYSIAERDKSLQDLRREVARLQVLASYPPLKVCAREIMRRAKLFLRRPFARSKNKEAKVAHSGENAQPVSKQQEKASNTANES